MRVGRSGKLAHAFVDGEKAAEFETVAEAARHARSFAQGDYTESSGPKTDMLRNARSGNGLDFRIERRGIPVTRSPHHVARKFVLLHGTSSDPLWCGSPRHLGPKL
jgi:hypothetical protein